MSDLPSRPLGPSSSAAFKHTIPTLVVRGDALRPQARDESLDLTPLAPMPRRAVLSAAIIGILLALLGAWVVSQAGSTPSMRGPMPYIIGVVFAGFGLLMVVAAIRIFFGRLGRLRRGVGFGPGHLTLRAPGARADLPWERVASARVRPLVEARRQKVPREVLEVSSGERSWIVRIEHLEAEARAVARLVNDARTDAALRASFGTPLGAQRIAAALTTPR